MLGDNLDLLVSPGDMTSDRQRKSWHWFLVLLTQKRITAPDLLSNEDILKYHRDLQVHIAKISLPNSLRSELVGSGFSQTAILPHNQAKQKLHVLNVNGIILGHLSTVL